ncbi:MAG: HAD-IIIC family phosphatase [Alphaproteobacteria bacterium]|nr:HAD-IIIC family phosphatase [Alphaproteobacteria bacterium]
MAEPVRLIIWDLDETFWSGTLTEGGITYTQSNHDLVLALAKRGIMSTICSKNNFEDVKALLTKRGVWDYFVFPSINWHPKGPRLKQLIEDVQLRPESVLLIDDNPLNRREAEHFIPGIQTADVDIIPTILESPLFRGKNDEALSRLAQYKLLETRKADESEAPDNIEFLRSCNIQVEIDHDVEAHLDRAIELINRTNQLNFTKNRLPEDPDAARAQLRDELSHFTTQAAIIRVRDRYGDYGYCGFYLVSSRRGHSRLEHFCFSCRILNMGVERWVYDLIGRPKIKVFGEVLTDLNADIRIDWIKLGSDGPASSSGVAADSLPDRVLIRGACNVDPLLHYFKTNSTEAFGEFNQIRDSISVRRDHSLILRYAIEGVSRTDMRLLRRLGFDESDFETKFHTLESPCLRILACWIDAHEIVYRHKETGLLVPFDMRGSGMRRVDRVRAKGKAFRDLDLPESAMRAIRVLNAQFEHVGVLPEEDAIRNFDLIAGTLPSGESVFLICAPNGKERRHGLSRFAELNRRIGDAAARHPGKLVPVSIADIIEDDDIGGNAHFHRKAYHELYRRICELMVHREPGSYPHTLASTDLELQTT